MKKHLIKEKLQEHNYLGEDLWEMSFISQEIAQNSAPGQFLHMRIPERQMPFLRRPFSICNIDKQTNKITVIYRVIGEGTKLLATLKAGDEIDCMGPLGNRFEQESKKPLLIGGGIGIAPLVFLANKMKENHSNPVHALLGARSKDEMFWPEYFPKNAQIHITTDDGSLGHKGFVSDILPNLIKKHAYDRIYTCGPEIMMKSIATIAKDNAIPCAVSLERHMACGVGACLSCTFETTKGIRKKVCTDGPVFDAAEVFK